MCDVLGELLDAFDELRVGWWSDAGIGSSNGGFAVVIIYFGLEGGGGAASSVSGSGGGGGASSAGSVVGSTVSGSGGGGAASSLSAGRRCRSSRTRAATSTTRQTFAAGCARQERRTQLAAAVAETAPNFKPAKLWPLQLFSSDFTVHLSHHTCSPPTHSNSATSRPRRRCRSSRD